MKKTTLLGCLLLLLSWSSTVSAQVVLNEVQYLGADQIELKNTGSSMVNVSNWWFCARFSYIQLNNGGLTVNGSLMMMPGDIVTISGFGLNDASSDLGLYNTNSFASGTAMEDFVQYGGSGIGRESVAAAKGIWTAGDFVPTLSSGNSMEYDGSGNSSTDWAAQSSPSFGSNNANANCDGGMVTTAAGDTVYYCHAGTGGLTGVFNIDSSATVGANFTYVITDNQGNILGIPPADMVDVTNAPLGECWVWGLSYTGNLLAMAGDPAATTILASGCFDLSDNFVAIFRDSVDGGTVSTQMGADTAYVCLGSTPTVLQFDSLAAFGTNFQYVVTDNMGNILGLPPGDMVDFSGAGTGECWVWGLSYSGSITAMAGDNAASTTLADGCYELSTNYVVVYRDTIMGGTVSSVSGDTVYVCHDGSGVSNGAFNIDSTGAQGPNFTYVVTDNMGNILGVPPGDIVDATNAPLGECWVWGLSYSGDIIAMAGDNATTTTLTDGCYELSSNFIVIFRDSVAGGTVSTQMGADTAYVCLGSTPTVLQFDSLANFGTNFQYVVTDNMGNILGLPPGDMVDFSGAGTGECWVWGLSYSGSITAMAGDNAGSTTLTDGCYELSANYVVVYRDTIMGGTVSTAVGDTVYVCHDGSGVSNGAFNIDSTGAQGPNFTYVVTDNMGNILGVPPGDIVDATNAPLGECWVWGLSYSGDIIAMAGDNAATTTLTDGCYELSSNYVVIFRDSVAGGMVSTQMGADTVNICLGGTPEMMRFDSTATFGTNFQYVVTDNMGNILGLPPGDMVDFSGAGPGECWVWGLSYTGSITAMAGDNAATTQLTDGCYELSANYVVVYRDSIEGGMVTTVDGDTVYYCHGGTGGPTGAFNIDSTATVGDNFTYVITDNMGNILGVPPGDIADVTNAPLGECWVWGLSYNGDLLAQAGDPAASTMLASGCFELSSNYVVIFRDSVAGGTVSTQMGADTVNICLGGAPEAMRFDSTATFGANFQYVVTDNMGNILGLPPGDMVDFSGAGVGECWVWGMSYTGSITAIAGDNAATTQLTDGCYELSSNYVVVYRDSIEGGMVQSELGLDTLYVCYSGGTSLVYAFDSTMTVGDNFSYVVTDPTGNILGVPPADMVDFSGAGPGECWVWGLSYNGELTAMMGDNALTMALSSECFELSTNYIVVMRDSTGAPCATAIDDELDLQSFRLYPVPAQDQVIVEFEQSSTSNLDARLILVDAAGRQVSNTALQAGAGQQVREEINLQGLAKGVYVLRITSQEGYLSKRFIKL